MLTSLGLQKVPEEPCLFTNRHCLVFFFVDDIVILYHRDHESHVRQLKQDIMATYHMRDLGELKCKLSEFLVNLSPKHIDAAEHAICYLNRTKSYAIKYSLPPDDFTSDIFICASNAAYADNEDRKSTEGYLFKLFGGPVDWHSGKQKTITTSTTEAKLLAISEAGKQIKWWN
ncbi:hypothetical protein VTN00DRAFT_3501 [Thermoascus crustaceus]|uniref:uncharacterized protein n=1 Tax=Thermoascus crustaceus TaxID=5088 RepID=UPI003743120C